MLLTRYYRLDKDKSLVDNLCHKTVVEFPVLQVVMREQSSSYELYNGECRIALWYLYNICVSYSCLSPTLSLMMYLKQWW